jgi:peptidoglycan/LPS O-acetylase OafA/YrhL
VFAAWVFAYHVDLYLDFSRFLGPAADLIRHGYIGVDGFFIMSGMILARVHPEMRGDIKKRLRETGAPPFEPPSAAMMLRFWGKRLARIYPVHLATILILAALVGFGVLHGWTPRDPSRFDGSSLLQNLLLVQGWGGSDHGTWNYPSWSVSTEWAGYLAFPILWYLATYFMEIVSMQILVACCMVLGLVFVLNDYSLNLAFAEGMYRFCPEFLAGMATTRVVYVCADFSAIRQTSITGGLILGVLAAAIGADWLAVVCIWLVLFAFLMQADTGLPAMLGRRPVLNWLGKRSYSFYMTFSIAELLMCQYFRRNGWVPASHGLVFALGMLVITLALAVSLYTTVEVPCRRLADRWLMLPVPAKK